MVVSYIKRSYYSVKGGFSVNSRGGDDTIITFGIDRSGVFGGGIQCN
jgi:hypothetical protein